MTAYLCLLLYVSLCVCEKINLPIVTVVVGCHGNMSGDLATQQSP